MRSKFQTAVSVLFPPRCVSCGALVESDFGLCGACWGQTPFIARLVCNSCGIPLPGVSDDADVECDDCLKTPRPWRAGRSALLYKDRARQIVLALKHGGRAEVAIAARMWLFNAGRDFWGHNPLIVPVPLHWSRLFRRTFNQSALLAKALADHAGLPFCPDLLTRNKPTKSLDNRPVRERFDILDHAIAINPKRREGTSKNCRDDAAIVG